MADETTLRSDAACRNHRDRPARTRGLCSMCYQREWRSIRRPTKLQVAEAELVELRVKVATYEGVLSGLRRALEDMGELEAQEPRPLRDLARAAGA